MGDRSPAIAKPFHIIFIKPDAMSAGKFRTQQPQLIKVRSQRFAIEFKSCNRLHLGFS